MARSPSVISMPLTRATTLAGSTAGTAAAEVAGAGGVWARAALARSGRAAPRVRRLFRTLRERFIVFPLVSVIAHGQRRSDGRMCLRLQVMAYLCHSIAARGVLNAPPGVPWGC